ncbi:phosphoribosylanthranilate isomerase [Streptomyces montanus]|uniref:N-(5'-phosphoribosyl)anthranilate isomerase n=1 Tax=Streptomyces montanus TaxID=2580423 RepID=A0A5R9FMM4_9ACTN|nr:phosphoribosylanthranilate isomerase [Streptomyces montanus]
MNKLVQVAGIIDAAEAEMITGEGADWIGFALRLPSGKDDIAEQDAAVIIKGLEAPHAGVLISYLTDAEEISEFCRLLGVVAVQLHGDVETGQLRRLKEIRPDLFVLKSLVVKEDNAEELLKLVDDTHPYVDMYITDTFDPRTGAKGATGLTHDWNVSAELVRRSPKPLMMAGGLNPENVADAIRAVRPAAVDAHSGLEGPDGRKDRAKVARFVAEARRAFDEIG